MMMSEDVVMSQKPYLIRAMYEWMLDFGYTPRLVVCPLVSNVTVPEHLSHQTQITLDISPQAISGLLLGNDSITFEASFEKTPFEISLPLNCVGAIIAKEKEVGYVFDIDDFIPKQAYQTLEPDSSQDIQELSNSDLTKKRDSDKPSAKSRKKEEKSKLFSSSKLKKTKKEAASSKKTKGAKKNSTLLSSLRQKIRL